MFRDLISHDCSNSKKEIQSIQDVIDLMKCKSRQKMFSEIFNVLMLFLTLPVKTCTAERSFSALRCLKTYLRSTMGQERLNHVAILHCYRTLTESIDIKQLCNDFLNEMIYD
ncbi:hypothetical protein HELRODRAFT_70002 [Helobdella robusta]|uniref:HAT C-terminal dimerisation domain-containing protein n=1 Tax=Helobdella robusta TaxID=6412 RepID=T1G013_HELRO|nr:hypothetical protein HELRODRAFT_70002 [Helobdella robusta]ESN91283.1 hypothetical protein HELRODRAFT_70002 [Helobdella robusta]